MELERLKRDGIENTEGVVVWGGIVQCTTRAAVQTSPGMGM